MFKTLFCINPARVVFNRLHRRNVHFENNLVKVTEEDGIRDIRMVDIKSRNSLTLAMTENLRRYITTDVDNPSLRAIIISSAATVFSAGHNLKELADSDGRRVFYEFSQLMMDMIECPVPIITVVDGLAAAAGLQIVAQSDIVVASPCAKFSTPGAKFGIFCSTPGISLVRAIPQKVASYMLFTGNIMGANEAHRYGLVSLLSKDGDLDNAVEEVAEDIKCLSRTVLEQGKKFLYQQMEMPLSQAYEKGAEEMESSLTFLDGIEGLRSFAEKRTPKWRDARYV